MCYMKMRQELVVGIEREVKSMAAIHCVMLASCHLLTGLPQLCRGRFEMPE